MPCGGRMQVVGVLETHDPADHVGAHEGYAIEGVPPCRTALPHPCAACEGPWGQRTTVLATII